MYKWGLITMQNTMLNTMQKLHVLRRPFLNKIHRTKYYFPGHLCNVFGFIIGCKINDKHIKIPFQLYCILSEE